LCLVLLDGGGTAYAAAEMPPANSVGTKQIKKEAVTPAKLSKAAKLTVTGATGPKGDSGPAGPQCKEGPRGTPGLEGVKGQEGKEGPAGTALAYALIDSTGNVVAEGSKGVTQSMVRFTTPGTYCFTSLPPGTKSMVAVANGQFLSNVDADRLTNVSYIPANPEPEWTGCSAATDPVVTTYDLSTPGLASTAFMI
jgi:hypothetical protein